MNEAKTKVQYSAFLDLLLYFPGIIGPGGGGGDGSVCGHGPHAGKTGSKLQHRPALFEVETKGQGFALPMPGVGLKLAGRGDASHVFRWFRSLHTKGEIRSRKGSVESDEFFVGRQR